MSKSGRDDDESTGAKTEADSDDSGKINGLQIAAATGAATTAAMVANALGIYGTVTGVAVFSIVSSVGTVVYLKSMRHTKAKFDKVVKNRDTIVMRARPGSTDATVVTLSSGADDTEVDPDATRPLAAADATVPIDPNAKATGTAKVPTAAVPQPESEPVSALTRPVEFLKRNWRPIAVSSLVVFVLTVGLLTSIALLAGKPATSFYDADPGPSTTTAPDSPSGEHEDDGTSSEQPSDDGTSGDQPSTSSEPDQPSSPETTTKQPSPSTSESEPEGDGDGDGDLRPTPGGDDTDAS